MLNTGATLSLRSTQLINPKEKPHWFLTTISYKYNKPRIIIIICLIVRFYVSDTETQFNTGETKVHGFNHKEKGRSASQLVERNETVLFKGDSF